MARQTSTSESPEQIALDRIEKARRTKLLHLNLGGLGITHLPPEIGQLSSLQELYLQNNQLTALPPEIGQLSSLQELYLQNNQLAALPPEIGQLSSLRLLDLRINQLAALPPEIGQLSSLQNLYFSSNQLVALPPQIGQLSSLQELFLGRSKLAALPPEIGQLSSLQSLYLSANQLAALPPEIGQLSSLQWLYLSANQLAALPPEIGQLSSLQELDLSANQLAALPPQIGQLSSLQELYLSDNQLAALPPEIGQLSSLRKLYVTSNQLAALPPEIGQLSSLQELRAQQNLLTALPESLRGLPRLAKLFLHANRALRLSPSILGLDEEDDDDDDDDDRPFASPKSILDFYFSREAGATRPLNELKLVVVGRGGVGKTSVVSALQGHSFNDAETSTPGIALCDWEMDACKGEPVTAHIWDFAGQVITHALHQFFFSVRSIYILVLTGRDNRERDDAEYWLRLVKAFGTDADGQGPPVIVALNKWDVAGCRPRLDRGALKERYPFIRGFIETDCKSRKGITKLKTALCREADRLKWVREPFPAAWAAIRRRLAAGKKKQPHLTYAEFRARCAGEGITDPSQQDSLAEILHNLGAALNYRMDPRLREATVLVPEWLTRNVYALMRRAEKKAGVLNQSDIDATLEKEKDAAMRKYLVRIMERFEIAYTAPKADAKFWLVPQALPDEQPKEAETFRDAKDVTRLRYTYPALPEGLVAKAIVRLHEFIEELDEKKLQWASGAILSREGARALLRTEPQDRQVMITVSGPEKARQQLAGLCRNEMRDIHAEIRGLDPLEETQVEGEWVSTRALEIDEQNDRPTGISTKDRGTLLIDPTQPNNAYSKKPARSDDIWKPTVFVSYSKDNVSQRKRLESELKILQNEGLLNRAWHDRMIAPGDKWNDVIQRELSEADVIIILVTSAALSTDYITEHEIPKALELHRAGKTIVVPVILEKCRWEKTALGELNALPEKAKPVSAWTRSSHAWNTVSNGLATVFENLMKTKPNARNIRMSGL